MSDHQIRPSQKWLLKAGADTDNPLIAEVTAVDDVMVNYLLGVVPAQVLLKHFNQMIEREWADRGGCKKPRENWGPLPGRV